MPNCVIIFFKQTTSFVKIFLRFEKSGDIFILYLVSGAATHFLHNHPGLRPATSEAYFFNKDNNYKRGFSYYK
mgnify:CR=1 FL=1